MKKRGQSLRFHLERLLTGCYALVLSHSHPFGCGWSAPVWGRGPTRETARPRAGRAGPGRGRYAGSKTNRTSNCVQPLATILFGDLRVYHNQLQPARQGADAGRSGGRVQITRYGISVIAIHFPKKDASIFNFYTKFVEA